MAILEFKETHKLDLLSQLNDTEDVITNIIVKKVFQNAAKDVVNDAKLKINSLTGNLANSIGYKIYKNEKGVIVGARVTEGFKGFHAGIIEKGTTDRIYINENGNPHFTGAIKPSYYLSKAFDVNTNNLENLIISELNNMSS